MLHVHAKGQRSSCGQVGNYTSDAVHILNDRAFSRKSESTNCSARLLKSSNRYEDVEKRRCGVAETRHTSSDFFEFRYLVYQQQINRYNNFTAVESA